MKGLIAIVALLASASAAVAAPPVRVSAGSFPISSLVVVPAGSDIVLVSGTTAPSPPGGVTPGDTTAQTVGALTKIDSLLKAQGLSLADIVMMRVYLVGPPETGGKMDFAGMMKGYTQFFGTAAQPNKPARTTVQVAGLAAPGALVEIDAEAVRTH